MQAPLAAITLKVKVLKVVDLPKKTFSYRPYVVCYNTSLTPPSNKLFKTPASGNGDSIAHVATINLTSFASLEFIVRDKKISSDKFLGLVRLNVQEVLQGLPDGWGDWQYTAFDLKARTAAEKCAGGKLVLGFKWISQKLVEENKRRINEKKQAWASRNTTSSHMLHADLPTLYLQDAVDEAKEPPPHAVDDVFRVLDKYPENRQAVQVCGFSLQALLKVPSSAKTIVSLDWISLVLRILRIHDDDEDILVNFLPLVDLLIQTHALSLKPVNVKSACWLAKELWKVASRPATPQSPREDPTRASREISGGMGSHIDSCRCLASLMAFDAEVTQSIATELFDFKEDSDHYAQSLSLWASFPGIVLRSDGERLNHLLVFFRSILKSLPKSYDKHRLTEWAGMVLSKSISGNRANASNVKLFLKAMKTALEITEVRSVVLNGAVAETLVEFLKRFGNFGPDYDQESKDNLSAVKRVLDIIPSFSGIMDWDVVFPYIDNIFRGLYQLWKEYSDRHAIAKVFRIACVVAVHATANPDRLKLMFAKYQRLKNLKAFLRVDLGTLKSALAYADVIYSVFLNEPYTNEDEKKVANGIYSIVAVAMLRKFPYEASLEELILKIFDRVFECREAVIIPEMGGLKQTLKAQLVELKEAAEDETDPEMKSKLTADVTSLRAKYVAFKEEFRAWLPLWRQFHVSDDAANGAEQIEATTSETSEDTE